MSILGKDNETLRKSTDEELLDEAREMHASLFVTECYGKLDPLYYEVVLAELESRGYEVITDDDDELYIRDEDCEEVLNTLTD